MIVYNVKRSKWRQSLGIFPSCRRNFRSVSQGLEQVCFPLDLSPVHVAHERWEAAWRWPLWLCMGVLPGLLVPRRVCALVWGEGSQQKEAGWGGGDSYSYFHCQCGAADWQHPAGTWLWRGSWGTRDEGTGVGEMRMLSCRVAWGWRGLGRSKWFQQGGKDMDREILALKASGITGKCLLPHWKMCVWACVLQLEIPAWSSCNLPCPVAGEDYWTWPPTLPSRHWWHSWLSEMLQSCWAMWHL